MKEVFGTLENGTQVSLYTLQCGKIKAQVTDLGATLVRLWVPDRNGDLDDIVLGYDCPKDYIEKGGFLGATVGRNANRIRNSSFVLNDHTYTLTANENAHNLHSGPDVFQNRVWKTLSHSQNQICFGLESPHGDQGFPGNASIRVTYALEPGGVLAITYDAISDRDTVFNFTNHSYFNLAGHQHPEKAMAQTLCLSGRFFNPDDAESIPTGELRNVEGTPMDFRTAKPIGRDIDCDYEPLQLQGGYDHNYEVFASPCAYLSDPDSGRTMAVVTDCPGIQFYAGNFLDQMGKNGIYYHKRSGICLETQFYPDAVNHPEWPQPFCKAGQPYHSCTRYIFEY